MYTLYILCRGAFLWPAF